MFILDHVMKRFFRRNKHKGADSSLPEPVPEPTSSSNFKPVPKPPSPYNFELVQEPTGLSNFKPVQELMGPPQVTWNHSWSPDETQDALSTSPFIAIPTEIMMRIFRLLSVRDLCHVSLVCRWFKMVADQDEIWQLKCNSKCSFFFLIV
jgi:hypothetical protein